MNCEHWEKLKIGIDSGLPGFNYGNCKLCNQICYCNRVKEDCDYKKEEINETTKSKIK